MRTSERLKRVVILADLLREERGDTEWADEDRAAVALIHDYLEAIYHQTVQTEPKGAPNDLG